MKTFSDHMREAGRRVTKQPDVAMQHLRDAEPLAESADDWARLSATWGDVGAAGHDEARRCADRALADAGDDFSIYRSVATTYRRELGDEAGARAILDRCLARYQANPAIKLGAWCYLASAYMMVLDDRESARGCLDRAAAVAPPAVDELCQLATGYKEIGDLDAARASIDRALALLDASDAPGDAWSVANVQAHALDDRAAAWATFERALARTTTVAGCLRVAVAMASHAEIDGRRSPRDPVHVARIRACLIAAERFAASAVDWIDIADVWHEQHFDAADVRRALERAEAAAPDAAALTRIAHGYRHRLGDAATADRLAPRGIAPSALVQKHQRLDGWDADAAGLLDWLRPQLTAKAVREMSLADWGSHADMHKAVLEDIRDSGLIPQPLEWHPREVLELSRWSEGDKVDHVARAFACTVLVLDAAGPTYRDGHEQSMAVLIESCLVLGDEALARAVGLLVAVADSLEAYRVEYLFALLGVMIVAAARDPRDPRLRALADHLTAAVTAQDGYSTYGKWGWLLDRTNFDQRHKLWLHLADQLLAAPAAADPSLSHLADLAKKLLTRP